MAAYDNVSLPGAPNIATAGNFAQQLFSMLSQLPQDYYKGQQSQYQQRQNNLFSGGVPTNDSGNIDYATMARQMIQSGGAPVAGQLLPLLQKQPFLDQALKEYQNESGGGTNTGPAASTAAASPASITGATQQQPSVNANPGAESVRTLSAGIGGSDRDIPGAVMDRIARSLGLTDANAGIPEGQLEAAKTRISDFLNRTASSATSSPTVTRPSPVPQSGTGGDENNTNQGTPVGVGGSSAISPAPTSASGNIAGTPAQRPATPSERINAAYSSGAPGGAAGMVPPGYDPLTYAEALKRRAEALRRQANTQGIIGIPTKAKEDQASALDKQADAILEQLGKAGELTNTQKDVASGATQRAKSLGAVGEAKGKRVAEAITSGGTPARQTINTLDVMEDALRRSGGNLTTGPGAAEALKFKQAVNNLIPGFFDPKAIVDAEAVTKLNARLAADAAKAMTARPSQLEFRAFMQNNPGLGNSVQGSMFLISVMRQMQQQAIGLGKEAMRADPDQWADIEDKYYKDHPLTNPFTGKPFTGKERIDSAGAPPVGHIEQGYRFKGGDHRDKKNWEPVSSGDRS